MSDFEASTTPVGRSMGHATAVAVDPDVVDENLDLTGRPFVQLLEALDLVRSPRVDHPVEALVAAAHERSLAGARRRLGHWFDRDESVENLTGHHPRFDVVGFTGPQPDIVADYVDQLLTFRDLRPPRIGFGLDGASGVDDEIGARTTFGLTRIDATSVARKLAGGAIVGLSGVDQTWDPARTLVGDLERLTWAPGRADLLIFGPGARYTTIVPAGAVELVAPLEGRLTVDLVTDDDTVDETVTVEVGSAFIAPSGWRPRCSSSGGATALHLQLRRISRGILAAMVIDEARFWPTFRADLPYDATSAVHSYGGSLFDSPDGFPREFATLSSSTSLDRAATRLRAALPARPSTPFSRAMEARLEGLVGRSVRSPLPGGICVVDRDEGELITIAGAGTKWQMSWADLELVVPLLDGELHEVLDSQAEVAIRAVEAGMIEVAA